jgi:hypothetical protein
LDRDASICRAYETGFAIADVGQAFALSTSRVGRIVKKHALPSRSPCIPALIWDGQPLDRM